jgi:hypothetical protein
MWTVCQSMQHLKARPQHETQSSSSTRYLRPTDHRAQQTCCRVALERLLVPLSALLGAPPGHRLYGRSEPHVAVSADVWTRVLSHSALIRRVFLTIVTLPGPQV